MSNKNNLKSKIKEKLKEVMDPELNVSIVDLGLIYNVIEKQGSIFIKMTLTNIGCPLFPVIEEQIKSSLLAIKGVKKVNIELIFDPPWTTNRMSKKAKAILGL